MTGLQAVLASAPSPLQAPSAAASACSRTTDHARGFGNVVARHLGLPDAPALVAQPAHEARLGVSRLSCATQNAPARPAIAAEDSFVVMLHLADYRHDRLWSSRGCPIKAPSFPKDSIIIVNLMDELSANILGPLDALSFYIPRETLDRFTEEAECSRVGNLACAPAQIDPVMANLGAALLPALEKQAAINALFVDGISLALQAHVAASYGGAARRLRHAGGLTRRQEARAKHYLTETNAAELSLAGAAATCGLSRSYFSRAFKAATGVTPHRWLLEYRVGQARQKLRTSDPLANIAVECGFADQSHFTRVFTQVVGIPPGAFRRHCGD